MIPKSDFEVKKDKSGSMFNIFKQLILPQKKLFITVILASILLSLNGEIKELGNHEELMDLDGNYFNMVKIQNYKIDETQKESIIENDSEIITYT